MNELETLREENEKLKEDLAVKVAAIHWALDPNKGVIPHQLHRFELHARAYPEPENVKKQSKEIGDSTCEESDGCPTEMAVLKRFWREHNPEPETEEVEVVSYYCPNCETYFNKNVRNDSDTWNCCPAEPLIKLTGTRTIHKPRRVKRREEVSHDGKVVTVHGTVVPSPGRKIFVEWEEVK